MSSSRQKWICSLFIPTLFALASAAGAQTDTLRAPGLEHPVEIVVDRWGIPHIYAQSERDLFFAQGYNAARDRLFQLELWRRQATGTLSEVLGPRTLKKDIGARLLTYRGDMRTELSRYHERGPEIFDAFVRGINAYVERTEREPQLLPVEFGLLGIRPQKWTVDVVFNRLNGLFRNVTSEVQYAQLLQTMDAETLKRLAVFTPADPDLSANGVDLSLITSDIVELYRAARAPVEFRPEDIQTSFRSEQAVRRLATAAPSAPDMDRDWMELGYGSNNWVVSGRLTMSGSPMLVNDPHRAISVPALRYVVHLVGPGWNVIGSGEPTVPGVSMGHNEHGAFGLTIHGMDMEDLYVYEINPANPNQYRYRGSWEDMRVVRERIPVKGRGAEGVDLKFTRHGPVLYEDRKNRKAYALRAAWLEPGTAPYVGQLRYAQARNWEEFREGVSHHLAPAHNVVWADVHGDIGWHVAGIAPIRPNWSGLLPVPGDGRFEWQGYKPIGELPHKRNPPEGFIATANEHNVPPDYKFIYSYEFSEPYRSARIHELLLSGRRRLTAADMNSIHQDVLSIPARSIVPLLNGLASANPEVEKARSLLLGWNFELDASSVPAAIYIEWERSLSDRLHQMFVPPAARRLMRDVSTVRMVEWLMSPDGRFGSNPTAGRDTLLLRGLEEAVAGLAERLGPDMDRWQYGRFKHLEIRHPLSELVRPELRERMDVGPAPRGGTGYTVNPTGDGDNQTSGPSYRIIADAGNWDQTVGITMPGQSGDPSSPHYSDLFEAYVTGKYIPFFFTRSKIDSVRERVMVLTPGR